MTVAELLTSQSFELFFHHEYCEQSYRQFQNYATVLGDPLFTFEELSGPLCTGRFLAQVEFEDGPHGATNGTFRLILPDGMDKSDAHVVLDNATLDVVIETSPRV